MRRKYSLRTNKFSLVLLGAGAGLLSMIPTTHGQTKLMPLAESTPVIRSPRELMTASNWSQANTADANNLTVRSPAALERVMVNPDLVNNAQVRKFDNDVIVVDSSAFNLEANNQPKPSVAIIPAPQQLQPLKIAVNWTPLQPIKQTARASQIETKTTNATLPKIVSPSQVASAELLEPLGEPIATKQVTATIETLETAIPKANLAFLRKPMDLVVPSTLAKIKPALKRTQINTDTLLQPISTSAPVVEPAKKEATRYNYQASVPSGPISLFVDGPDYLRINQVGEYEIAVANSSANAKSVPHVSLQVPNGAEIIAVQREAKIDDQSRTLTWRIDKLGSGKQQRIRFRVKMAGACKADFAVTIAQDGREPQTVSQTTVVK